MHCFNFDCVSVALSNAVRYSAVVNGYTSLWVVDDILSLRASRRFAALLLMSRDVTIRNPMYVDASFFERERGTLISLADALSSQHTGSFVASDVFINVGLRVPTQIFVSTHFRTADPPTETRIVSRFNSESHRGYYTIKQRVPGSFLILVGDSTRISDLALTFSFDLSRFPRPAPGQEVVFGFYELKLSLTPTAAVPMTPTALAASRDANPLRCMGDDFYEAFCARLRQDLRVTEASASTTPWGNVTTDHEVRCAIDELLRMLNQ